MITISGLQKSCRYSYPTNKRDYCGPKNAFEDFTGFVLDPSKEKARQAMHRIQEFPVLYAYYGFLARQTGLEPLDEKIISHYWLCAPLKKLDEKAVRHFVSNVLVSKGLSPDRAKKICSSINGLMYLFHPFHVLRINFITGKVEKTAENFSKCLVLPAKAIEKNNEKIIAEKTVLLPGNVFDVQEVLLKNPFNINAKKNTILSVHWNTAIEKISQAQANRLKKAVQETLL